MFIYRKIIITFFLFSASYAASLSSREPFETPIFNQYQKHLLHQLPKRDQNPQKKIEKIGLVLAKSFRFQEQSANWDGFGTIPG